MEYYLVRFILWLRKSDIGLALLLGFASWIVLSLIQVNFPKDSRTAELAWRILAPGFIAGFKIGRLIFPDDGSPTGHHLYLVGLMGGLGSVLSFSVFWYLLIRIYRVFRPKGLETDGAFHQ